MDIVSYLPTWLTAMPVNLMLVTLVLLYVIAILKDNLEESKEPNFIPELGVICGHEAACKRLAGSVRRAERFELATTPEQVLDHAIRRNMVSDPSALSASRRFLASRISTKLSVDRPSLMISRMERKRRIAYLMTDYDERSAASGGCQFSHLSLSGYTFHRERKAIRDSG